MLIGIDCRLWFQTGVGRYIQNLVLNLSEIDKENNYRLFVREEDVGAIQAQIKSPNLKTVSVNIPWHSIKEQLIFPKIILKENLDLVHFTYFSMPVNYKKDYVLTVHDLILNHFKSGKASTKNFIFYNLKRYFYLFAIRKGVKDAKKIISVSKATEHELIDHMGVPGEKISVIYEGIDERIINSKSSTPIIKDPYILYVGNVYPHKNVEKMILAFFKAEKPEKGKLVLIGKKDFFYERLRKKIAKIDSKKRVVFMGALVDDDLANFYRNAKALIMPSLMEGFGLPVLEAMGSGCLVLASDIPSLREIAGKSAIYFNPTDINDISKKIKWAFSDSDKKAYISEGINLSKNFSWKKMARETLSIYESSVGLRQS